MELCSVRQPKLIARLEYENQGVEPRLATLIVSPVITLNEDSLSNSHVIQISGTRTDDAEKIALFRRLRRMGHGWNHKRVKSIWVCNVLGAYSGLRAQAHVGLTSKEKHPTESGLGARCAR
jgi:hypothetical protein